MKQLTKEELLKNPLVKDIAIAFHEKEKEINWHDVPETTATYDDVWKELVSSQTKPAYTILSFKNKGEILFSLRNTGRYLDTHYDNEGWGYSRGSSFGHWVKGLELAEILSLSAVHIHSVRRESDGEVFTVGDLFRINVDPHEYCDAPTSGKIVEFLLQNDEILIKIQMNQTHCMPRLSALIKVKEQPKEWEITAFKDRASEEIHTVSGITRQPSIQNWLNANREIYSVKRLNDGVEFKIGDRLGGKAKGEIVTGFEQGNLDLTYMEIQTKESAFDILLADKAEKLFTTEDGVDIYDGDTCYSVYHDDKSKIYLSESYSGKVVRRRYYPDSIGFLSGEYTTIKNDVWKRFASREKAEEYILYNKPCLSLKDIELGINNTEHEGSVLSFVQGFTPKLKELVKSKLNIK